jgi:hypothetical protein
MTVRGVISRKLFRKRRALKYPVNCVAISSGAPSGAASTKSGTFYYSVATKGMYGVITTNSGTNVIVGVATLIGTGTV